MKYVAIDIETTGIDPVKDKILSLSLVIEDTSNIKPLYHLPYLNIVIPHKRIEGDIYALNMNKDLIKMINDYNSSESSLLANKISNTYDVCFRKEVEVVNTVKSFLEDYIDRDSDILKFNIAGKNVADFDWKFLERLPYWNNFFSYHRRVLDPTVLFADWKEDKVLPNLQTCLERAGFDKTVSHTSYEDALDVIRLLRTQYT